MELRLNALSPQLCSLAVANRLAGFKTEPAYYAALFPEAAVAYDDARAYAFLLQDWSRIELTARQRAEELSERAACMIPHRQGTCARRFTQWAAMGALAADSSNQ
jgi:hypothetical protein